jgi:exopolysaccharide biosynthesis protein
LLVEQLNHDYVLQMLNWLKIRNSKFRRTPVVTFVAASVLFGSVLSPNATSVPAATKKLVSSLVAAQWQQVEEGLQVIRAITADGVEMTAFRISPDSFTFSIELQDNVAGSKVKAIAQQTGAVIASNAGFFASRNGGELYSVGYLRLGGEVKSKGWSRAGGILSFLPEGLSLKPSYTGIPDGEYDVIQSKPMLIEPGQKWAMDSNAGSSKPRTVLCTLENGDVILSTISRNGTTLYEAGWVMRARENGGFFGCDAALAFDGGRSTQMWYSGDEKYSSTGLSPVHNFFVVRQKED